MAIVQVPISPGIPGLWIGQRPDAGCDDGSSTEHWGGPERFAYLVCLLIPCLTSATRGIAVGDLILSPAWDNAQNTFVQYEVIPRLTYNCRRSVTLVRISSWSSVGRKLINPAVSTRSAFLRTDGSERAPAISDGGVRARIVGVR